MEETKSGFEDCGVIYAVTGEKYFGELRTSILSLRQIHPYLPVAVFVSGETEVGRKILGDIFGIQFIDLADLIQEEGFDPENGFIACRVMKVRSVTASPFKYTLFLDNDTYIRASLQPIFDALRGPDGGRIVLTNEPVAEMVTGSGAEGRQNAVRLVELSNPHFFNGGVFAFRKDVEEYGFENRWFSIWKDRSRLRELSDWQRYCDQTALNNALSTLPDLPRRIFSNTKWNAQCKILNELYATGRWDQIRIIHCKMVHHLGHDPEELLQSNYIKQFRVVGKN